MKRYEWTGVITVYRGRVVRRGDIVDVTTASEIEELLRLGAIKEVAPDKKAQEVSK